MHGRPLALSSEISSRANWDYYRARYARHTANVVSKRLDFTANCKCLYSPPLMKTVHGMFRRGRNLLASQCVLLRSSVGKPSISEGKTRSHQQPDHFTAKLLSRCFLIELPSPLITLPHNLLPNRYVGYGGHVGSGAPAYGPHPQEGETEAPASAGRGGLAIRSNPASRVSSCMHILHWIS